MQLTHHAYFYEGSLALLPALATLARAEIGLGEDSPDVLVESFEKFGIADARALRERALMKSTAGKSLFVIGATTMNTEAQQALLKLFEEPSAGAVFVLLVPHGTLLPTLRSRCLPFPALEGIADASEAEAKKFLIASGKERSEQIAIVLKDDELAKQHARDLLNALEAVLYAAFEKAGAKEKKDLAQGLADVAHFRGYLADRSPSLKMILEHLAASLPKTSS